MESSYPKAHGGFLSRRKTPSRPPTFPISRGVSSATCSTNFALSISGSTSWISRLLSLCRTNEACRRLSKLPGVGPVIATALVAAVDDGRHFRSGRELAAWIGLVPRQYTTGGKPRLGGIGRRANHYLRRQMIHGARAVMFRLTKHEDRRSQWLKEARGEARL